MIHTTMMRPYLSSPTSNGRAEDAELLISAQKALFRAICRPASDSSKPTSTDSTPSRAAGVRMNRDATQYSLTRAAGLDHAAAQDAAAAGLSAVEMLEAGERAQAAAAWESVVTELGAQPVATRKHDDDATGNDADAWASVVASFGGTP